MSPLPLAAIHSQCQLYHHALVTDFLLQGHRALLRRGQPSNGAMTLGQHMAVGLLRVLAALAHNRTFAALRESTALGAALGWRWDGTHLTALGHGARPCWDQVSLLRVLMHEQADSGARLAGRAGA